MVIKMMIMKEEMIKTIKEKINNLKSKMLLYQTP